MTVPVIINGALGKMGIEIANLIFSDSIFSLKGVIERPGHPSIGQDYGSCIGKGILGLIVTDSIIPASAKNGIIIDFSSLDSTRVLLSRAVQNGLGLVIGTTGLTEAEYALAKDVSKELPILVSPNMSLGVNILFSLTKLVASKLKDDFDIEIIEAHHRFKKDAPSGTAKRLGEIAADAYELSYDSAIRNGRTGMSTGDRPRAEVGMHAVRGGDIVGDHTVLFAGIGERLELRHMAHNRSVLARGAVVAAKWLASQKAGFYSMQDVLGL